MNNWRSHMILLAAIILLPFAIVLVVALIPYLGYVGIALAGLITTWCLCLATYGVTWTWQRIHAPRVIVERDVVVMLMRDGSYRHLSAEQEQARAVRLLQAP